MKSARYIALYCLRPGYSSGFRFEETVRRLKSLLPLAVLLSPGLILVGLAQDQLTIDASKQPAPPARGRGPSPGSLSPGHSAGLPIRIELRISSGPLQPDGTTLVDFVITNVGTGTIALPSSLDGNGPRSDILTLWFTSDAIIDASFKDTASGRTVKIELVPTSAELYGRSDDPHSFLLVAPNQSVKVHASSRVQLQPGTHTAIAHAELLHTLVRDSSVSSERVGTADSEAVTTTFSTANPR
jgi:hypothetical protein